MATNAHERERALSWIASQLRWERALAALRGDDDPHAEHRQAA